MTSRFASLGSPCRNIPSLELHLLRRAKTPAPARWLACLLAGAVIVASASAAAPVQDDFSPLVKLEPFVVQGKQLSVSIHARSDKDRRYAQGFAEEVIKVVYESVTPETGKGLVIIGAKGEPHPIVFFRKFLALADAGKLDPGIAARAPELTATLNHWREMVDQDKKSDGKSDGEPDLEFEKILTALPLPLEGLGAKLYQLAWTEKFDDARVEARLRALRPDDLDRNLFTRFDWVFYLPPRNAFDHVLDEIVADALKQDDVGFFARTAARGVMLVVKPKIRRAIEAVRQGLLFHTVVQTRSHLPASDVSSLTEAYIEALMPGEHKHSTGSEHERAVRAVREQFQRCSAEPHREANGATETNATVAG